MILIASDHGGYELKEVITGYLKSKNIEFEDIGADSESDSVDYPDFGIEVAKKISGNGVKRAILVCGTGIGMCIVANKFPNVRAALVNDPFTARLSREHNDSNILVLGGRVTGPKIAIEIVDAWLNTEFEGGRHARRLDKIKELEKKNFRSI